MGEFNKVTYLYGWCQKIIPLVYDDSLSYYENICKAMQKLNEVITNTNMIPDMIKQEVQDFINSGQIEEMIEEMLTGYLQRIVVNVVVPPQGITPAKGNGNDDTETFQQCIDYLTENGGGLLFVPDGDWMVKPLTIKNGVYIAGASVSTKITLIGGSSVGLISGTVTDCGVSKLTLSNNAAQQTVDKAVIDITCNNITLDDLIVKNGYMGVNVTTNNGALIHNIRFDTLGYGGLYVNGSNADVSVSEITVKNVSQVSGQFGIENDCDHAVFNHIAIYGPMPTGFSNTGAVVTLKNAILVDCGTGIFNVGDGCNFSALIDGSVEVISDAGERTSYTFKGQNSQRKIGERLLNVGTESPIMYRTPTKISSNFNAIPFQDYNGNQYNVLVEGESTNFTPGLSVTEFGAVGDGVTDDSTAFNNWLTYVIEHNLNGWIPNGTYYIAAGGLKYDSQTLNNYKWSITGESVNGVVLKFGLVNPDTQPNCLDFRYCQNFVLRDFTIECPGNNMQTSGVGLYLVNVRHVQVSNIEITNCSRAGVNAYAADYLTGGYCFDLHFNNVNIHGVENNAPFEGEAGTYLYPMGWILSDCVSTFVDNCFIENLAWYGFEFKNYCKNSWFRNCNARNCVTACHIGGELRVGDTYGFSCGGYDGITCYDVDTPIVAGSAQKVVFNNIVAYYSDPYTWQSKNTTPQQYSIRVQNMINCVFNVELYNIPHGGIYFTENFKNNVVNFNFISGASNFIGRWYYSDETSTNNKIRCRGRLDNSPFIYDLEDRNAGNLIIDEVLNAFSDFRTSLDSTDTRTKQSKQAINPNNSVFGWAADNLIKSNYSENNIVTEVYGDLNEKYVRVDYNTAENDPYVDFRLYNGTTTVRVRIDSTGAHVVS